jgi:hypothetical protein
LPLPFKFQLRSTRINRCNRIDPLRKLRRHCQTPIELPDLHRHGLGTSQMPNAAAARIREWQGL